ncbi:MAG: hypothetical protein ACU837_04530 [Gammaproteobacteria bacterium]
MKTNWFGFLAAVYLFSGTAAADTEWVYRTLMGNTLPLPKCADKSEATNRASRPDNINNYAKRFCATQGYGWSLKEVKNDGRLICEPCIGNSKTAEYLCHVEDVVAVCKRIKPGSVGMLPGKG